jgi:hypothetical protein
MRWENSSDIQADHQQPPLAPELQNETFGLVHAGSRLMTPSLTGTLLTNCAEQVPLTPIKVQKSHPMYDPNSDGRVMAPLPARVNGLKWL